MCRLQLKITPQTKNQDHLNSKGKRQSTDANTEKTQILELSDKDFTVVIIKILQ